MGSQMIEEIEKCTNLAESCIDLYDFIDTCVYDFGAQFDRLNISIAIHLATRLWFQDSESRKYTSRNRNNLKKVMLWMVSMFDKTFGDTHDETEEDSLKKATSLSACIYGLGKTGVAEQCPRTFELMVEEFSECIAWCFC